MFSDGVDVTNPSSPVLFTWHHTHLCHLGGPKGMWVCNTYYVGFFLFLSPVVVKCFLILFQNSPVNNWLDLPGRMNGNPLSGEASSLAFCERSCYLSSSFNFPRHVTCLIPLTWSVQIKMSNPIWLFWVFPYHHFSSPLIQRSARGMPGHSSCRRDTLQSIWQVWHLLSFYLLILTFFKIEAQLTCNIILSFRYAT